MCACAQAYAFFLFISLILTTLYQEMVVATAAKVSETLEEPLKKYCGLTLTSLAYAGTGNVLKVTCLQKMHEFQRGCTIPTSSMHS